MATDEVRDFEQKTLWSADEVETQEKEYEEDVSATAEQETNTDRNEEETSKDMEIQEMEHTAEEYDDCKSHYEENIQALKGIARKLVRMDSILSEANGNDVLQGELFNKIKVAYSSRLFGIGFNDACNGIRDIFEAMDIHSPKDLHLVETDGNLQNALEDRLASWVADYFDTHEAGSVEKQVMQELEELMNRESIRAEKRMMTLDSPNVVPYLVTDSDILRRAESGRVDAEGSPIYNTVTDSRIFNEDGSFNPNGIHGSWAGPVDGFSCAEGCSHSEHGENGIKRGCTCPHCGGKIMSKADRKETYAVYKTAIPYLSGTENIVAACLPGDYEKNKEIVNSLMKGERIYCWGRRTETNEWGIWNSTFVQKKGALFGPFALEAGLFFADHGDVIMNISSHIKKEEDELFVPDKWQLKKVDEDGNIISQEDRYAYKGDDSIKGDASRKEAYKKKEDTLMELQSAYVSVTDLLQRGGHSSDLMLHYLSITPPDLRPVHDLNESTNLGEKNEALQNFIRVSNEYAELRKHAENGVPLSRSTARDYEKRIYDRYSEYYKVVLSEMVGKTGIYTGNLINETNNTTAHAVAIAATDDHGERYLNELGVRGINKDDTNQPFIIEVPYVELKELFRDKVTKILKEKEPPFTQDEIDLKYVAFELDKDIKAAVDQVLCNDGRGVIMREHRNPTTKSNSIQFAFVAATEDKVIKVSRVGEKLQGLDFDGDQLFYAIIKALARMDAIDLIVRKAFDDLGDGLATLPYGETLISLAHFSKKPETYRYDYGNISDITYVEDMKDAVEAGLLKDLGNGEYRANRALDVRTRLVYGKMLTEYRGPLSIGAEEKVKYHKGKVVGGDISWENATTESNPEFSNGVIRKMDDGARYLMEDHVDVVRIPAGAVIRPGSFVGKGSPIADVPIKSMTEDYAIRALMSGMLSFDQPIIIKDRKDPSRADVYDNKPTTPARVYLTREFMKWGLMEKEDKAVDQLTKKGMMAIVKRYMDRIPEENLNKGFLITISHKLWDMGSSTDIHSLMGGALAKIDKPEIAPASIRKECRKIEDEYVDMERYRYNGGDRSVKSLATGLRHTLMDRTEGKYKNENELEIEDEKLRNSLNTFIHEYVQGDDILNAKTLFLGRYQEEKRLKAAEEGKFHTSSKDEKKDEKVELTDKDRERIEANVKKAESECMNMDATALRDAYRQSKSLKDSRTMAIFLNRLEDVMREKYEDDGIYDLMELMTRTNFWKKYGDIEQEITDKQTEGVKKLVDQHSDIYKKEISPARHNSFFKTMVESGAKASGVMDNYMANKTSQKYSGHPLKPYAGNINTGIVGTDQLVAGAVSIKLVDKTGGGDIGIVGAAANRTMLAARNQKLRGKEYDDEFIHIPSYCNYQINSPSSIEWLSGRYLAEDVVSRSGETLYSLEKDGEKIIDEAFLNEMAQKNARGIAYRTVLGTARRHLQEKEMNIREKILEPLMTGGDKREVMSAITELKRDPMIDDDRIFEMVENAEHSKDSDIIHYTPDSQFNSTDVTVYDVGHMKNVHMETGDDVGTLAALLTTEIGKQKVLDVAKKMTQDKGQNSSSGAIIEFLNNSHREIFTNESINKDPQQMAERLAMKLWNAMDRDISPVHAELFVRNLIRIAGADNEGRKREMYSLPEWILLNNEEQQKPFCKNLKGVFFTTKTEAWSGRDGSIALLSTSNPDSLGENMGQIKALNSVYDKFKSNSSSPALPEVNIDRYSRKVETQNSTREDKKKMKEKPSAKLGGMYSMFKK